MVCRKNNWNEEIGDIALINGLFGHVVNIYSDTFNGNSMSIDFKPECLEDDWFENVTLDYEYLCMSHEERKNYGMYTNGNLFEYGYGSTIHLSQGSQYGYVLLIEEYMGDQAFQNKLMYTGATRAENTLVIVKNKKKKQYPSFFF